MIPGPAHGGTLSTSALIYDSKMAHLQRSNWLHRRKRMERTAGHRSFLHLTVMVATTFAVVGMGSGLVSSSMTAASAAVVRSSDLSPHGAFVPDTLYGSVVAISPTPDDKGYLTITANGFVSAYGDGVFAGGQAGGPAPVVGIETGEDTGGFWTVRADGGVFTIGDVPFYGSMGGKTLNAPVVGMALTPDRGLFREMSGFEGKGSDHRDGNRWLS